MKKILVLCDDKWHPAEVIQKGFTSIPQDEYVFEYVMAAKDILTREMIEQYPLIISCKSNNVIAANEAPWFEAGVTEVDAKAFQEYVEKGGSFLAIHSANAYMEGDYPAYNSFVGNTFVTHPPRCTVEVHVEQSEHPISKNVQDFTIRDEHYEITNIAADAEVFLTSRSEKGGHQVCGYTRIMGKGKLCALLPGHTLSVWQHREFQTLLMNAIDWCCN